MTEDEKEAKWEWTWVDAWRDATRSDPTKFASLLLSDAPLTRSMREFLAYLAIRGRIKPDPEERKANVTLLVAAVHFRALEALRREERKSRSPNERRLKHHRSHPVVGPRLCPWHVPVCFGLVVDEEIPEETRRSLKHKSRDDLLGLVAETYNVSGESLCNLLACRGRLYRQVRAELTFLNRSANGPIWSLI